MRRYITIIFLSISTSLLLGQVSSKIPAKFQYTDIDSLVHLEIKNLKKEKIKFAIVNSVIYVGATLTDSDTTLMVCDNNPFDIFFLFLKGNDFFVKRLDNHGYFKTQKLQVPDIKDFVSSHCKEMEKEKLILSTPPNAQIVFLEKYTVVNNDKIFEFELQTDHDDYKPNLSTFKYQLTEKFSIVKKELFKNKQERIVTTH